MVFETIGRIRAQWWVWGKRGRGLTLWAWVRDEQSKTRAVSLGEKQQENERTSSVPSWDSRRSQCECGFSAHWLTLSMFLRLWMHDWMSECHGQFINALVSSNHHRLRCSVFWVFVLFVFANLIKFKRPWVPNLHFLSSQLLITLLFVDYVFGAQILCAVISHGSLMLVLRSPGDRDMKSPAPAVCCMYATRRAAQVPSDPGTMVDPEPWWTWNHGGPGTNLIEWALLLFFSFALKSKMENFNIINNSRILP